MTASDATPTATPSDFDAIASVIRRRRTSMLVDSSRPVASDVIQQLCELASWAPNHKKTWPWRFASFSGEGRARLGETMTDDMIDADFGDETKRTKTQTKYLRTPAVLAIGSEPHANDMLHAENRDAVAAAIQNILLGATALGLASFWSTPALTRPPKVLSLCGFAPEDRLIGIVYLGWADRECPVPERPTVSISQIDS